MSVLARALWSFAVALFAAATAEAQTVVPKDWTHGTTLQGFAGVATGSSTTGLDLGAGFGWEVTPRFAIDGAGSWMAFGDGYDGFAAAVALRARLWGERKVDPFVLGGVGLYRASFDCGGADSLGGGSGEPCGAGVPEFYRQRMGDGAAGHHTFTDPTLVLGGGVNLFLTRHLALRPDVQATVVMRGGDAHVVTALSFQAVFHFEDHPITPMRR